jgi:hypothetical protein
MWRDWVVDGVACGVHVGLNIHEVADEVTRRHLLTAFFQEVAAWLKRRERVTGEVRLERITVVTVVQEPHTVAARRDEPTKGHACVARSVLSIAFFLGSFGCGLEPEIDWHVAATYNGVVVVTSTLNAVKPVHKYGENSLLLLNRESWPQ